MMRILLADDHSVMRMGLATLVSSERDMCVVGAAQAIAYGDLPAERERSPAHFSPSRM